MRKTRQPLLFVVTWWWQSFTTTGFSSKPEEKLIQIVAIFVFVELLNNLAGKEPPLFVLCSFAIAFGYRRNKKNEKKKKIRIECGDHRKKKNKSSNLSCVVDPRVSSFRRHGDRYETMPTSVGGGHGLVISRRVLLIVGLTVSIVLVVCAFTLLLVLQGSHLFHFNFFFCSSSYITDAGPYFLFSSRPIFSSLFLRFFICMRFHLNIYPISV